MKHEKTEYFPIVNEEGVVTGKATRAECHSGSFILHPVVHLHVINSGGRLYLQKRVSTKDIQPDKWDTSVGGHVDWGETIETALLREAGEELNIFEFEPVFIMRYKFVSTQEAELIHSFYCIFDGKITPDPVEISEGRYWSLQEIENQLNKGVFTPNFENELKLILQNETIRKLLNPEDLKVE